MIDNLEDWAKENGYTVAAYRYDGKIIAVLIAMYNTQIIVGDEFGVNERYSYPTTLKALIAFDAWKEEDFKDEPEGWIRHQPSNRRRQDGDPTKEIIRE